MALCSLTKSYEGFEENHCSHTKVRIMSVQQNIPHLWL